jgi:hypothetical protein
MFVVPTVIILLAALIVGFFLWRRAVERGILKQDIMSETEMCQDSYTLQFSSADLAEFSPSRSRSSPKGKRKLFRRSSDSETMSDLL